MRGYILTALLAGLVGFFAALSLDHLWFHPVIFVARDGHGVHCTFTRPCAFSWAHTQHPGARLVVLSELPPYRPGVPFACPCDEDGVSLRTIVQVLHR